MMVGGNFEEQLVLVDGVDLRTDKTELKNMADIVAIVGLDSCKVDVWNRLLITCTLVSVKGDTKSNLIKPLTLGHVDNINRIRRCENFHAQDLY